LRLPSFAGQDEEKPSATDIADGFEITGSFSPGTCSTRAALRCPMRGVLRERRVA